MPLLTVKDLSITFYKDRVASPIVEKSSFTIDKGEVLALIGESGSGKSMTALGIMQLLTQKNITMEGSIQFDGQELMAASAKELQQIRGNKIAMIFQEPMTSLNPLHTIEQQISEVLFLHKKMDKAAAVERVKELLKLVQLDNLIGRLDAYPHELSGGQRQRVMIAMALACEPALLIADEPTTALDVTIQKQILELLADLQKKTGMAMLFITHDLHIVKHIANNVCVMQKGVIVEQGPVKKVLEKPAHAYTKMLLSSVPSPELVPVPERSKRILQVEDLKVSVPVRTGFWGKKKSQPILTDISLSVKEGHTLGIVGESGSGKSTLAMALLRLMPSEGTIFFQDRPLHSMKPEYLRPLRKHIQVVFQDPFASLNPRMTVEQIIAEGMQVHHIGTEEERFFKVKEVLEEVGLDPSMRHRYPHEFSGGQRQRIAIARALVLHPRLIILDEPTSALDVSVQAQVVDLLKKLQRRYGLTLLFISHDLRLIKAISHDIIVMRNGQIVERGPAAEVLSKPKTEYMRLLMESCL